MAENIGKDLKFEPEISEPFVEGFNRKTIFAALFIGFIMLPGSIYLSLITGGGLAGAAQWVTVILLVEIAKRSFVQLRRQEIYIVYILAGSLMAGGVIGGAFGGLIWNQYFVQSPYAQSFGLIGNRIPSWAVPPAGSEALLRRTFLHRDWAAPIFLLILGSILMRINSFSFGYLLFRLTSDREKLPFPMAPVASEGATALAEASSKKETWRWRVFSISAMIGVLFGAVYVVIPTITGLLMTNPLQLIPIPWVDFTDKIGNRFPASMFGFTTDLGSVLAGFVIPFWVVIGSFIGSVLAKTFGNPLLYKLGLLKNWHPGMTVIPASVATTMDFWLNVTIAGGIVVGLIGLWRVVLGLRSAKEAARMSVKLPPGRGDYPAATALTIWFLSTLCFVVISHILVPEFPVIIYLLFAFVFTPFLSYTSARMFGITGVATGISFPYVREASFLLSGYKGTHVWFAPFPLYDHGSMPQAFKQLELTRTKFTSWYKAEFMALGVMLFCSFLFWSIIWRSTPIPSASFPFVQKIWPMNAMFQALWVTSTLPESGTPWILKAINARFILGSSLVNFLLYGLLLVLKWPLAIFYGIIGGVSSMPHATLPMFLGALLGRFYFRKKIGPENWRRYTPILLAGYTCGMGLIGMVSVAVALIAKTVFQIVF